MPAWAISLLIKLAIDLLEHEGVISAATAAIARVVAKTKTYPDYPKTEGQKAAQALPEGTTNVVGLTVGKAPGKISDL